MNTHQPAAWQQEIDMKKPSKFRPSFEALENRLTPAGLVNVSFAAGVVTITGDGLANSITITQDAQDRLIISDFELGNGISLNGGAPVNQVTTPAPVTGGVTLNLNDGADSVVVAGVDLPSFLKINGGNGSLGRDLAGNRVILQDGVNVKGKLTITNLEGIDTINLADDIVVTGALSIQNGNGGCFVTGDTTTTGEYRLNLQVGGAFSIVNGLGADSIGIFGADFIDIGSLIVNNDATGADVADSAIHCFAAFDLNIRGPVNITNGGGFDSVGLDAKKSVTINGDITIVNKNGGSAAGIGGNAQTISLRNVSISNGAGADHNRLSDHLVGLSPARRTVTVRGNVTFNNGVDADQNINTISGHDVFVSGNVTFLNGAGSDANNIGAFVTDSLRVNGSITITNGAGGSTNRVASAADLLYAFVGGATQITSAAGNDQTTLGVNTAALTLGPVTINHGADGGAANLVGSRLQINGALAISATTGEDDVTIASVAKSGSIAQGVSINLGAGDDQDVTLLAFAANRSLTIGGALAITLADTVAGGDDDGVNLVRVRVQLATTITTGANRDQIRVDDCFFSSTFTLDTGLGNDLVEIERTSGSETTTRFRGAVRVNTGDGADTVRVGGNSALLRAIFNSSSVWDGGPQLAGLNDILSLNTNGNVFFGPAAAISNFEVVN
jgi:hypothetical protein